MKKKTKAIMIIAITSLVAVGIAAPIFRSIKGEDVEINGKMTSVVNVEENELTEEVKVTGTKTEAETTETEVKETTATETEAKETAEDSNDVDETTTEETVDYKIDYKYMKKYPEQSSDSYDENFDLSSESSKINNAKPDDFSDPEIKKLAEEYINQGYYLTDEEFIFENFSNLYNYNSFGIGDYGFVVGFEAVDKTDGDNTESISVLKCTREEFEIFLKENFEGDETDSLLADIKDADNKLISEGKADENDLVKVEARYGCNTITYNLDTEVLIYRTELTGEGV
ncbi:MAG: hypothetical protein ILA13_09315, partial [Eubacterium sp.]|nr:hypothetical protein [Eubacterium sp.]